MKRYRVTIEFEAEDDRTAWDAGERITDVGDELATAVLVRIERASEYWAPVEQLRTVQMKEANA